MLVVAGIFLVGHHSLLRYPGNEKVWGLWFDAEPPQQPAAAWVLWAGLGSIIVGVGAIPVVMGTSRRRLPTDPPDSDDPSPLRVCLFFLVPSWAAGIIAYLSSPESDFRERSLHIGLGLPFLLPVLMWFSGEWSSRRGHTTDNEDAEVH